MGKTNEMIRIRHTWKDKEECKDFYENSCLEEKGCPRPESVKGIPSETRWEWALDTLKRLNVRSVLEVGCWYGDLPVILNAHGFSVDAIEPVLGVCEAFKKFVYEYDLPIGVHQGIIEEFKNDKLYDSVVAFEVIEHPYDLNVFLEAIWNQLEEGGYFLFSTPSKYGVFGPQDDNFLHLYTASVESCYEVFAQWEVIELFDNGSLVLGCVKKPKNIPYKPVNLKEELC